MIVIENRAGALHIALRRSPSRDLKWLWSNIAAGTLVVEQEEKTRMKAVQLLLSRGADVNLRDDAGRSAFSYACELRCNDVVQILIKNNVDPDITDNEGISRSVLF